MFVALPFRGITPDDVDQLAVSVADAFAAYRAVQRPCPGRSAHSRLVRSGRLRGPRADARLALQAGVERSWLGDSRVVARESVWVVVGVGCAGLEGDASAACGYDEYVAVGDSLWALVGGFDAGVAEDCPEHDSRLGKGKGGADASSGSAAEGNPGVGPGACAQEPLGAEGERVGVDLGAAVYERYVGDDHGAAWDG
jgi:hypothetical protein